MNELSLSDAISNLPAVVTGRQLKAARILAGLTRAELAKLAGISLVTVNHHEQYAAKPLSAHLETRLALVQALWRSGVRLLQNEGIERISHDD